MPHGASSRSCPRPNVGCSSPMACSAWTGTSARCRRSASSRKRTGCIMMVDDAHASGVFGQNGRGTIDHFGVHGRVDVQVGTLSKAIGALGGYVAGNRNLIEFLHQRARPFLFSTSHPPAVAAACIAALDVLLEDREIMERLWDNTRFFKTGLERLGFNTGISESPITPVIAGDSAKANTLSDRLFEEGVFAQAIGFPTVARDKARVRTIVTATHTRDDLQYALDAFAKSRQGDRPHPLKSSTSDRARALFDTYTRDLSREDLQRLFTHDTRDAYQFFTRGRDDDRFAGLPTWKSAPLRLREFFVAFTLRLSPGTPRPVRRFAHRRADRDHPALRGFAASNCPFGLPFIPGGGADACLGRRHDRPHHQPVCSSICSCCSRSPTGLSLKGELEVAREIQLAMLPRRHVSRRGHRDLRHHPPGQHRRRRFLRCAAASRRPDHRDAGRRRRQGQSGRAADGVVAGGAAHAG